jgi:3D (Asp-Asp-Asp) domain-containing protein
MRKFKRSYNKKYGICVLILSLIISQAGITSYKSQQKEDEIKLKTITYHELYKKYRPIKQYIVENEIKNEIMPQEFIVTAYDLSVSSTGKSRSNPEFGITKDGTNLKGENWRSARVIAVDPNIIPLGSSVSIEFVDEKYKKYNGIYVSRDIGGAIKGNRIDLFIEDNKSSKISRKAINFGKTIANVTILEN